MGKATPPKISNWGYSRNGKKVESVKIATSNLFLDTGKVPVDFMVGAIFNEIGGQEFINSYPVDFILDNSILPISNISEINDRYSPLNILPISDGILANLNKYNLSLSQYELEPGENSNEYLVPTDAKVYIDSDYRNIIIEFENVFNEDEVVEVEFLPYSERYEF
jgi:hypothetical protein